MSHSTLSGLKYGIPAMNVFNSNFGQYSAETGKFKWDFERHFITMLETIIIMVKVYEPHGGR